jgi:hypothetical protein
MPVFIGRKRRKVFLKVEGFWSSNLTGFGGETEKQTTKYTEYAEEEFSIRSIEREFDHSLVMTHAEKRSERNSRPLLPSPSSSLCTLRILWFKCFLFRLVNSLLHPSINGSGIWKPNNL